MVIGDSLSFEIIYGVTWERMGLNISECVTFPCVPNKYNELNFVIC